MKEKSNVIERKSVGDLLQQGLSELLEIPLPTDFLGDRKEGLSVLVAAPVDSSIEERLDEAFERSEKSCPEKNG